MKPSVEVTSDDLREELQQIKERITTLETLQAHVHRDQILEIVAVAIGNSLQKKAIVIACAEPLTKDELKEKLGLNSTQALDRHLTPLREHGVIEESSKIVTKHDDGEESDMRLKVFSRARILAKLPKRSLDQVLK